MKLNKTKSIITEDETIEGLVGCSYEYSIKDTKVSLDWLGPKIPQNVWYEVTSFLKWTYDQYKSESQVRLFVSPTLRTWKAWAFPQQAKTGMSALELDNEMAREQRAALQLNPPDWLYFGTVHHHCSMGAFQSGTDRENEEKQDGLHITVGNLDKDVYDIHCRFYRKGCKFETTLNMSWFFETGDMLATWPKMFSEYMPPDLPDKTARKMMCQPVTLAFPEEWKANIIEIKPPVFHTTPTHTSPCSTGTTHSVYDPRSSYNGSDISVPVWKRAMNAWRDIVKGCIENQVQVNDLADAMQDIESRLFGYRFIIEACIKHHVDVDDMERLTPVDLEREFAEVALMQELKDEHDAKAKQEAANPKSNGHLPGDDDAYSHMIT